MPVIINGTTGISGVDGSAGTPAFQGSDANTGIRFGTDIVSLVTGGSDRLYIDSAGRLGIGTTSPNYELQINASDAVSVIQLTNTSTGATASDGLLIYNNGVNAFISNEESGFLKFQTAGAERAQIDASGRLLVGTSSAGSSLTRTIEIHGTGGGPTDQPCFENYAFTGTTADRSGYLQFYRSRGTSVGTNTIVASGDQLGVINFRGANGSSYDIAAQIKSEVDGTPAASNDMPGRLVFSTTADGASSPTERMRISNDGVTSITSPSLGDYTLSVKSSGSSSHQRGLLINFPNRAPNDTSSVFWLASDSSSNRGILFSNGGLYNYQSNNSNLCDEREKKNIEPLDSTWDCLKHWELKKFHYNEDVDTDAKRYGVIAQQVEQHCPEVLTQWIKQAAKDAELDDDGNVLTPAQEEILRKGVKEQQMYWMAIKALQEAQLRIEQLETLNASFEARLAALEVKP